MDRTPLHPDVEPIDASLLRHGTYRTAIPHTRRMFRTKFACRIASMVLSILVLSLLSPGLDNVSLFYLGWLYGGVAAGCALIWDLGDMIYLLVCWWRLRRRGRPMVKDTWGPPGLHVAMQLIIWLLALVLDFMTVSTFQIFAAPSIDGYSFYKGSSKEAQIAVTVFLFFLGIVHFILFVFACLETDYKNRNESDVIFVPNENLQERAAIPPSSFLDVFRRRKLAVAYYANHYVRYVPAADGTLRMARDYSSRHVRV